MLLCCKKKANQAWENYIVNRKQQRQLVCGFVASSRVLIFAVNGDNPINIPEIFLESVHGFPAIAL